MNAQYQDLYRLVENLEFKLRDKIDDRNHPLSTQLLEGFRRLVDSVESEKSPRSLEDQTKNIIELLSSSSAGGEVMDHFDADFFEDMLEEIRLMLKKFDNY